MRNFPPPEYRGSQQNWAVTQDRRGIMYFGNNDGLLEFDGINWHLTKLPIVRTIAIDSLGRIYVGLENDMGYLQSDHSGNYHFRSLKEKIPEIHRELTTVLYAYATGEEVIFLADDKIFIYKNDQIKVLSSEKGFHFIFNVNNRLYVREWGRGLSCLDNDSLRFIGGSELFGTERIYSMLPYRQNEILIATRTQGIIVYSPEGPDKFHKPMGFTEVDNFLSKNPVYCGTVLSDKTFALGALTGGIIVFDPDGKIINRYNKGTGLQDNTIYWLYADHNHRLWAALDNGISLIPVNLPFRNYTELDGLNGSPMCLEFFKDRFYVGTAQYLHVRNREGFFEPIAGTEGQNFRIFEARGTLLLACYQGIFEIKDKQAVPLSKASNIIALTFCPIKNHPDFLLAGTSADGLYLMEYKNPSWRLKHPVKGFNKSVYVAVEDEDGNIWISTAVDVYKLKINATLDSVISWKQYTSEQGLPSNFAIPYSLNSGEVVFGTEKGVFRYRKDKDLFEPHPGFSMLTGKVLPFVQFNNGDIWFEELSENGNYEKGVLKFRNGKYILYKTPFYKFLDIRCYESPFTIHAAPDSTIFICTSSSLLQYDPSVEFNNDQSFPTLIRKVYSRDTLVYADTKLNNGDFDKSEEIKIPWSRNDIIFHFAAAFYEDAEKNLYSYRLLGSDTTWSAWVSDHKKEYTSLPEGRYTLEVKSKNQYQTVGSTASFSFRIPAPWYRTWLAFAGYVLLAAVAVYILTGFRTRQLKERSTFLEKIVEQRTEQLQEQKNNVEQLSRIGRDITSSLSIENIVHTVYENINTLMDASVFTIGLYKPEENVLEFPATIEKNQSLPPFSISLTDDDQLAAWCFNNWQDVVVNDYGAEYSKYISRLTAPVPGKSPVSVLYLPLCCKESAIGVISAQSFSKNAYSDYHVNILRNLAAYTAIALENADSYRKLSSLLDELKATQEMLVTQSKLAGLGTLTAGIAHEIKNPLNFVNNFAGINTELIDELLDEVIGGKEHFEPENIAEIRAILETLKQNESKIREHGQRADSIVRSMLLHSRTSSTEMHPTDINALLVEAINLTYHGMRAQDSDFNIRIEKSLDESLGKMMVIPQELSRAFLNIIGNACYEVHRKKQGKDDGYFPALSVMTQKAGNQVKISIRDNGNGIPEKIRDKMFTPFFTTKPAGQGTGLGLSITYDIIVHQHKGQITYESKENSYTEFIILLPYFL